MTLQPAISATDLYKTIVDAVSSDPALEALLLDDFDGTVARRFGVAIPKPGRLVRAGSGFRLSFDGKDYDLGDPRQVAKGELNDMELELVSAGSDYNCPISQPGGSVGQPYPTKSTHE